MIAYPLAADGLPATTPDWRLNGGLRNAWAIAFDGAGYLYVSDAGSNQVRVYAPGASGDDLPVRVIPLTGPGCAMTVNRAGYVFTTVALGFGCTPTVSIYSPVTGPQSEVSMPQPIHSITITSFPTIFDLITDKEGRLYVAPLGDEFYIYNDPVNEWQSPNEDILPEGREYTIYDPIALNEDDSELYMQTLIITHGPQDGADHAARSLVVQKPDKISLSSACNEDGYQGIENSLAVNRNYLMFTCSLYPALFVLHNRPGRQKPVETLPGGLGLLLWP